MARALAILGLVLAALAAYLWFPLGPRAVSLSGTIVVPLEWGDADLTLDLSSTEPGRTGDLEGLLRIEHLRRSVGGAMMHEDPNQPRRYLWKIDGVVPGEYLLRSVEFTSAQLVDTGP